MDQDHPLDPNDHHYQERRNQEQQQEGPVEKKMRPASDFAEYDELVDRLADRLKIARHPDSSITLKAARILIENILSSSSDKHHHHLHQQQQQQHEHLSSRRHERLGGGGGGGGEESKIQQSKFRLDDISLPKSILMKSPPQREKTSGTTIEQQQQQQVTNEPSNDNNGSSKDDLERAFERSARALKLLYLDDQKQLQNRVNETISAIQSITANPKTDPSLLATGR